MGYHFFVIASLLLLFRSVNSCELSECTCGSFWALQYSRSDRSLQICNSVQRIMCMTQYFVCVCWSLILPHSHWMLVVLKQCLQNGIT
uniref:Putative secreted protein n=1 Tax=Rhipicephalus microplus TaxID=6941 RepID=A0A6G5A1R5_RHIMP